MNPPPWKPLVLAYQKPCARRASWQIVNSVGSYLALWFAIAWTIGISWWLTVPLMALAGMLLVRVFIIFHDCGHGSFFASRRANDAWGFLTGVLAWTPYDDWRGKHAVHHGSTGNLERRGVGDIWTMTVREYLAARWTKRVCYRVARHPAVLLLVAPLLMFVFEHRIPGRGANARERRSVWLTTLCLVGWGAAWSCTLGFVPFVIVQLTVLAVAGAIGVWLFYSQHQFETAYWRTTDAWSYEDAALLGSTYLRLPRILQWFTGNIGFHHIHHLNSRIPNYRLQACHESHPTFASVTPLTAFRSLRTFSLKLWDEAGDRLIRFRELHQRHRGFA